MSSANQPQEWNEESDITEETHWIALSDVMTSLMLIFMLIAIAFMMRVEDQSYKIKRIAILYDQVRRDLYHDLMREFGKDLLAWDAEITPDLAVRFKNPDILFNIGKDELKPQFQYILSDFFPRYVRLITSQKYAGSIQEVRVEGHTSSLWAAPIPPEEVYFKNMELSQSRTRSTLRHVLGLPDVQYQMAWLRQHVTANGLSSSRPILTSSGTEDVTRSQRVEFHIRTNADASIADIVESMK